MSELKWRREEFSTTCEPAVPYLEICESIKIGPRSSRGCALTFSKYGTEPVVCMEVNGREYFSEGIRMTVKDLDQIVAWATACKEKLKPVEDTWTEQEALQ